MNKFGLTDTSIIDAIRVDDTVPYLVMRVTEVGPETTVRKIDGDSYSMFTFILKNEQNEEERTIVANVFGDINVESFFNKVKPDTVIAIKNAVASPPNFNHWGNTPYSLKLLCSAQIRPIENGDVDEKEVFFMKLRYGISYQQLQRVKSHYERLLKTSESD